MTDDEAFLAAICAAPQDDLPRLVYADFLEGSGQAERAEFIRAQCRLAELAEEVKALSVYGRGSDVDLSSSFGTGTASQSPTSSGRGARRPWP
jgi:uncharacterized protein (TIGR02996 family)